jgi:hypothetical protein
MITHNTVESLSNRRPSMLSVLKIRRQSFLASHKHNSFTGQEAIQHGGVRDFPKPCSGSQET